MSRSLFRFVLLSVASISAASAPALASPPLKLVQVIPLPEVSGRLDHMDLDPDGERLFIAAHENNSVEVVDVKAGHWLRSIAGFDRPQGVCYARGFDRLFVANGGTGACSVLDGASLHLIRSVTYAGDADNVRFDPASGRVYVGYGNGGIGTLDARTGENRGLIPLEVHPESFQIEPAASRLFVNLPDAREIALVNLETGRVAVDWPCGCSDNYPMALDAPGRRLFVGCRRPASVLIYDTETGRRLESVPIDGDVDDLFFDPGLHRVYVACGAGTVEVLGEAKSGRFHPVYRIPTGPKARTALFVPGTNRLYVAVPGGPAQRAEVRVFETAP